MSTWRWLRGVAIGVGVLLVAGLGVYERYFGCGIPPSLASRETTPIALGGSVTSSLSGLHPLRRFSLTIEEAAPIAIGVQGDFDTYLELYRGAETRPFAEDDDGGEGLHSQILEELSPGRYVILVRGFQRGASGDFTLRAAAGSAMPPRTSAVLGSTIEGQARSGVVTSVSGRGDIAVAAPCSVTIEPVSSGFNCRVRVTCAGQLIYGAGQGGYNNCAPAVPVAPPQQVTANDNGTTASDGDPRLVLDTGAGTATVSDGSGSASWSVTVGLAPPSALEH